MSTRINYDLISATYDNDSYRVKPVDPELVAYFEKQFGTFSEKLDVLDLGCGTGNQLVANQKNFPQFRFVGVDYSQGMLEQAKKKSELIEWIRSAAEELPFDNFEFDYVSCQYCYHHFYDVARALLEAHRVLKPGGSLVIENIDPFEMKDTWSIYRYFPKAFEMDAVDFWRTESLGTYLVGLGFTVETLQTESALTFSFEELLEFVSARAGCSQLISLPDIEYEKGLSLVEKDLVKFGAKAKFEEKFVRSTLKSVKI